MKISVDDINNCLVVAVREQLKATSSWHSVMPEVRVVDFDTISLDTLGHIILMQHLRNFTLWHTEDTARRTDVSDSVIADCKRKIDIINQERNDLIEKVDICLGQIIVPFLPTSPVKKFNTETPGMAIDRLSILALKVFHMEEQTKRTDVEEQHREICRKKLNTLTEQRESLSKALFELLDDYISGAKSPAVYYQFKMYNDPSLNPELYRGTK